MPDLRRLAAGFLALALVSVPTGAQEPPSDEQKVEISLKNAEQGDVKAMIFIADAYARGKGVEPDHNKAVEWFGKAAKAGEGTAAFRLGVLGEYGAFVPSGPRAVASDYAAAARWYEYGRRLGSAQSATHLGGLYMSAKGVRLNKRKALALFSEGADGGDPEAQYILGNIYLTGGPVAKDVPTGLKWLAKAFQGGLNEAGRQLGKIYHDGKDVRRDSAMSMKWYEETAERGDLPSMLVLAGACARGDSGVPNPLLAYEWYQTAYKLGSREAEAPSYTLQFQLNADDRAEAEQRAQDRAARLKAP